MTYDQMYNWLRASLWFVCVVTTMFPFWYGLRNKWWVTRAGIAILVLSIAVAVAWDTTLLFLYWYPPLEVSFWIQVAVHTITALAGLYILYALWYNRRMGLMITTKEGKE